MAKMAKRQSEEVKKFDDEYIHGDMRVLESELPNYKQKEINGALISSFFQWMCDRRICSVNKDGFIVVHDPVAYTRWNKADSKLQWRKTVEFEAHMKTFPEEKAAWQDKMTQFFNRMRLLAPSKK